MTTIFEIFDPQAKIKYKGVEYAVVDPNHLEKVKILDEWAAFTNEKKDLKMTEALAKDFELKKRYICLYVPTMKEIVEKFGQHTVDTFYKMVLEMANEHFGAQIQKIDDQKKSGPQVQT